MDSLFVLQDNGYSLYQEGLLVKFIEYDLSHKKFIYCGFQSSSEENRKWGFKEYLPQTIDYYFINEADEFMYIALPTFMVMDKDSKDRFINKNPSRGAILGGSSLRRLPNIVDQILHECIITSHNLYCMLYRSDKKLVIRTSNIYKQTI